MPLENPVQLSADYVSGLKHSISDKMRLVIIRVKRS